MSNFYSNKDVCILGVNSAYHEPSACLIRNGELVAAAEEERFNRLRHGKPANLRNPHWLPEYSIQYCLKEAGIDADAVTLIAYSLAPELRLASNVDVDTVTVPGHAGTREGEEYFFELLRLVPRRLSLVLGEDVSALFQWIEHHLCHAASAFFVSPFTESAVLSVDGIGEITTTWMGYGKGNRLSQIREIRYPNSLGFLWTKLSRFLGFGSYGQWKVMALAGYGDPNRYYDVFRTFITYEGSGDFKVDPSTLEFRANSYASLERLLGKRRENEDPIDDRHRDIAAALQQITNEALVSMTRWLRAQSNTKNLCIAGGVALNCVANRAILEYSGFEDIFIQPAANDAGTALGACFYVWNQVLGRERNQAMTHAYLGPSFSREAACLVTQINPEAVQRPTDLAERVARLIAEGKTIALFQGRMEFGPRALGNRSILADPRRSDMTHILNDTVKQREWFRPFGASVLSEYVQDWFEVSRHVAANAYMIMAYRVRPEKLGSIPAVTHVDGTTRIQSVVSETSPMLHQVIEEFYRVTGVPLVLNTSLNESEPIVCSPSDALRTCLSAGIDYLAVEGHLIHVALCDRRIAAVMETISAVHNDRPAPRAYERFVTDDVGAPAYSMAPIESGMLHEDVYEVFMSR